MANESKDNYNDNDSDNDNDNDNEKDNDFKKRIYPLRDTKKKAFFFASLPRKNRLSFVCTHL